jgi:hypothetical protein
MKKISLVESKAGFQQRLLEKFVQDNLPGNSQKQDNMSGLGAFAENFKEIESCAAETPVNGTVEIFFETTGPNALRRISVPVMSRFFVYCARDERDNYKVACVCSLS